MTITTKPIDIPALLAHAKQWAEEAGAIHLQYFRGNSLDIHTKLSESDIVTAADKAAESLLITRIREYYPQHAILSEESGDNGIDSRVRWVIDPLDGTTNFSEGLPIFAVSIGVEIDGKPSIGVVYAPYIKEMFYAATGMGAYLNGKPIAPRNNCRMDRAVISTGFPVDKALTTDNNLDNLARVLPLPRGIRRLGSAAMDMCYVAAGYLDGYWELNLHEWDVCAATVICTEAGADTFRFRTDREVSMLAASPGIFPQLLPLLSTVACTTKPVWE